MKPAIFLTIITVHYEDYDRLRTTMESIKPLFVSNNFEWVVIDGGSLPQNIEDSRLLVEAENAAHIYVSERDAGIYDAMNKGMSIANGAYVLYLNSGDSLHSKFSIETIQHLISESYPELIWGQVSFEYPDGSFGTRKLRGPKWLIYGMPVCHQAVFFLRQKFVSMKYDIRFKIAADYDLLVRAVRSQATVCLLNEVISVYAKAGVSQQESGLAILEQEIIRQEHFGIPKFLSKSISFLQVNMQKLSNFSPAFNRIWRSRI